MQLAHQLFRFAGVGGCRAGGRGRQALGVERRRSDQPVGQIGQLDHAAGADAARVLDHVVQLAQIARPGLRQQPVARLW